MTDLPATPETLPAESPPIFDWRFDLKTILLCVAAFAIPCRWVAVSSEQRWCVKKLESIGAYSGYDYEGEDYRGAAGPISDRYKYNGSLASAIAGPKPFEGDWLCDHGTRDMLHRVVRVRIYDGSSATRAIQLIARIGTVKEVILYDATLDRDLVVALRALPALCELVLEPGCQMKNLSLAELRESLPNCRIYKL